MSELIFAYKTYPDPDPTTQEGRRQIQRPRRKTAKSSQSAQFYADEIDYKLGLAILGKGFEKQIEVPIQSMLRKMPDLLTKRRIISITVTKPHQTGVPAGVDHGEFGPPPDEPVSVIFQFKN